MTQQVECLINTTMHPESEWSVRSKKRTPGFLSARLLYAIVIFVLRACVGWVWHINFATNLFEICLVSTIVFAPLLCVGKH
jgi:hypothetical protein